MAEKIVLAELNIDIGALIKNTSLLKKEIDALREQQKQLAKAGDTSSEVFVQNSSDLKVLTTAYNQNIKAISAQTQATADLATREQLLTLALDSQATSIAEAREQNKLLNKLRNETNVTTAEGIEQLNALNARLDENNEFIKQNADQYLKQKINIGNYSESIKQAFNDLNIFNGGLGGFIERSKEAGGVGNLVKGSLGGMAQGFAGVTKASLAFIATPIGAVLALLVGAFALIQNALNRSEDATNKLKGAFSIFSGVINTVLKALEPLGEFLIDGIVMGLELVAETAQKAGQLVSDALAFFGFDEASKAVSDFNNEIQNGIKSAKDLADAEDELEKAQRKARLTQLQFQKDAEKLRQIRDDETLSTQERIKANEDLGRVLQEQLKQELAIANTALRVANLRIEAEGKTKEALDAQLDALTQIADIEERITGQQSEQLVNRNSLIKEANDKARELAQKNIEDAIKDKELSIALFEEENRLKDKSDEDRLKTQEESSKKELDLLKFRFDKKLISQKEYNLEVLIINNELTESENKIEEDKIKRLQEFENRKKSLLDEIALKNETDAEAKEILKIEQDFEKQVAELEALQLSEDQKTELLKLIEENRGIVLKEIRDKFFAESLQKQKEVSQLAIDTRKQQADEEIAIVKTVTGILTGLLGDSLGAQLAGIALQAAIESGLIAITTASSQAKNLAQATAVAPPPFNLPFIAQAIGQNAVMQAQSTASISQIITGAALSGLSKVVGGSKFEKGGIMEIGGNRHAQGGTKFVGSDGTRFEAERGELIGVLNRNASQQFMDFNNAFGQRGGVGINYAENGGIIARGMDSNSLQIEQFAELTARVVESLPAPIVTVEDINAGVSRVNVIESGATFG